MRARTQLDETKPIVYPESDGQPMAENTLQFQWIVTIKENLEAQLAEQGDVFVAGDLLWYPVEGQPRIRRAPDAMVVFGRPKGYRGAYLQWREGGIGPQVAFEVLSPGNTKREMEEKRAFYETYEVEEYYLYDPDNNQLAGWLRQGERLQLIARVDGWVSPRLGIRFACSSAELVIYRPDGQPFLTFVENRQRMEAAERDALHAKQQADQERRQRVAAQQEAVASQRAVAAAQQEVAAERAVRAEAERRAAALAERLRALGIDPDAL